MPDTESQAVYAVTRDLRLAAAKLVALVPEEPDFMLYGPGFEIKITRTDPNANYPGKPQRGLHA